MFLVSFWVLFIGGVIQESRARSLQLSVNLSLAINDDDHQQQQQQLQQQQEQLLQLQQNLNPNLSARMLRNCMRETEISMVELSRFRVSLLSKDPDTVNGITDPKDENKADIDNISSIIEERNEESLQCFTHCLYEKLGLIKDGVFIQPDFYRKFYAIVEREKQPVRECMNLESSNNCETAYKVHMCYGKLKTLEAERRIREILEYNDNDNEHGNVTDSDDGVYDSNARVTTDLPDFFAVDPQENEIDKN